MYWSKRRKNNSDAARSREARRRKEFQTHLLTVLLKRKNDYVSEEVIKYKNTIKSLVSVLKIQMESMNKLKTTLHIIHILSKLSNEHKSVA